MILRKVVTSFLLYEGKILILKRSQKVGTMKGKWAGVSGYLELNSPLDQAYKEILEETNLENHDLKLIEQGDFFDVKDSKLDGITWRVHPFLFRITKPEKIILDWEHDEMKWIDPHHLTDYDTVPDLIIALKKVMVLS